MTYNIIITDINDGQNYKNKIHVIITLGPESFQVFGQGFTDLTEKIGHMIHYSIHIVLIN